MRYEIKNNTVTVFDDDGNMMMSQSYDPRNGKEISTQKEAESVGEFLVALVIEIKRQEQKEIESQLPPEPEPNPTEFILGIMEGLKDEN